MGVSVVVSAIPAPVMPGEQVVCDVRVRNTGVVVDQAMLDLVGAAAEWATVQPAAMNLLPGQEGSATLVFAPPRVPSLIAGPVPFALRVMSREDTEGSVIEESVVEVGEFTEITGDLVPRTSTGRRSGRHELALDNLGNHPVTISVIATDADAKLDFRIVPANPLLEPGTATFVKIKARPKTRFWRGPNRSHPFQVNAAATQGDAAPVVQPGNMVQQSMLPPWVFKALALAAVACLALAVMWFALFKPSIEATAKAVTKDNTEELAKAIEAANAKADQATGDAAGAKQDAAAAQQTAAAADQKAASADKAAGDTSKNVAKIAQDGGVGATTLDPTAATDFRVTTDVAPGAGFVDSKGPTIPDKAVVWVSDIVLQNPAGDTGTLRIQRGKDVLLVFGLQNFRDLDYHFIQPAKFDSKNPVVVSVECKNPSGNCSPSVFFSGQTRVKPKPSASASASPASD